MRLFQIVVAALAIALGILAGIAAAGWPGSAHAAPPPPANTQQGAFITSIVYWTGPNCIPVRYSEGYHTEIGVICGRYSERNYFAFPGQYVGADPMPFDTTVTLGCSLLISGVPDNTDYAPAGDRHNVDCLRVFTPIYSSYPRY